jgi:hypothetical protein
MVYGKGEKEFATAALASGTCSGPEPAADFFILLLRQAGMIQAYRLNIPAISFLSATLTKFYTYCKHCGNTSRR